MKKLLLILGLSVIITSGCQTYEERVKEYTEKELSEKYGEEFEMTSMKKDYGMGSTLIIVLMAIFGDTRLLEFESKEDDFTFTGSIESRLKNFEDEYIRDKHEYLSENDQEYKGLMADLEGEGIDYLEVVEETHLEDRLGSEEPVITYRASTDVDEFDADKVVSLLNSMREKMAPVQTKAVLQLEEGQNKHLFGPFGSGDEASFSEEVNNYFKFKEDENKLDLNEELYELVSSLSYDYQPRLVMAKAEHVDFLEESGSVNPYYYIEMATDSPSAALPVIQYLQENGYGAYPISSTNMFNLEEEPLCTVQDMKAREDFDRCFPPEEE
ncbi:hypothetical protein [Rossellomorea marisflavi]|uniref:hypothetical protein n=1 Tax=Rossellomorea marisflavi TaxID=189381 RepID=UPI002079662D|nr:hypothetical protein [Rossellomorea marisflavi]USK92053.1 hypothetical protein LIT29_21675 [Rossellomorea marisflavi]